MADTSVIEPIISTILNLGVVAGAAGGVVWGFSAILSNKIDTMSDKMEEGNKEILSQLKYHEQHDDKRFNDVNNELWAIRIRNAVKDGNIPELKQSKGTSP